jgi:hypothetical protein
MLTDGLKAESKEKIQQLDVAEQVALRSRAGAATTTQPVGSGLAGARSAVVSTLGPVPVWGGQVHVADEVAELALRARWAEAHAEAAKHPICEACDAPIDGEPAGSGLYFWSRDGELRFEEPALCEDCGFAIVATALRRFEIDEEEG